MRSIAERLDPAQLQQLPDEDIVARILAGTPALFELIMRRYNRRMYRIARSILGNDVDAEDAVQEAYIRAYLKLGQFRGPEGFASWLCQIATNEALMRLRRHRKVVWISLEAGEGGGGEDGLRKLRSADDPEAAAHEEQLHRLLQEAIDQLPWPYRVAFVLREVEQLSVVEAAAALGVAASTIKTRVHRARALLQKSLTAEFAAALRGTYAFDGSRCDRIVARVFQRLAASPAA